MIPLYGVKQNRIISLKGEESYFYEICPPDLEQLNSDERLAVLKDLERSLMTLDGVAKIFWIQGRLYINSFGKVDPSLGPLLDVEDPLELFNHGACQEINYYENYLTAGPIFIRLLSLSEFPEGLHIGETFGYPDFVLNLRKSPPLKAKSKLNMKRKLHFSSLHKGMRDLEAENAYKEAEELLEDVTKGERALFEIEIFFMVRASNKSELDSKTREFVEWLGLAGGNARMEERGLSYFHQSCIPGVFPSFKRRLPVPSDVLSYLIPYSRDFVMEQGLSLTSRSGNPVRISLFDSGSPNFNTLITGASGQGKSMLANLILSDEISRGTKAVVLDLGDSFKKNSSFHKGVVLSEKFNPLQFKCPRYLKEFVLSAIDEKMGKREEGRLFETIQELISKEDIVCFDQFLKRLDEHFDDISFNFSEIRPFITNEVAAKNDLIYCDFGLYPESMKGPLIIYLIEYFKQIDGRKMFIFDECWHLLSKNAEYIAECFRTFRKHDASAVAISQNVDDFSNTPLGRVIMQNTYNKFLFKQPVRISEFIDSHVESLMQDIHSKKGVYSEFLFVTDVNRKPLRYYPNPLEYQLFTTDKGDIRKFEFYMNEKGRFLDFRDAITNFTKIHNPDWRQSEKNS